MRVLGLDLSLTSTGAAIVEGGRVADIANFKSKGKKGDGYPEHALRIRQARQAVLAFWWHQSIDLAVIESPSYGSKFGSPHERSGLWWFVYDDLKKYGVPIGTVAPTTRAKYITGSGKSGKDVVLAHAIERYVHTGTPRIRNDDEADAVGLAAMGARFLGEPIEHFELDASCLASMDAAKWPV